MNTKPLTLKPRRACPQRLKPIAMACLAALMSASSLAADEPAPANLEVVIVKGLRKSIEDSLNVKRQSNSIVEAISAEELGKLPDASIAEALARLPGLTGQRGPDGRVNVISIRGLSPAFSGALLNGREVVSSNDGRAVEYDQFPSELIGQAIVYKTPDATLVGQGLSGTVDLRTVRPLNSRGRQMALNVRGERNSNGQLVPDVAGPTGKRFSFSYIDQFANNTIGVAAGFARLDVSTQVKQTENVEYGDYSPFGLPVSGNALQAQPRPDGTIGNSLLPMFWTATSSSKRNTRDGLMVVLEYKPNADLHSQLDLYYSKFDTHEVGGKFLSSFFATWGGGVAPNLSNVQTTQVGKNTLTTSARATNMPVTTGNFDTKRKDDIQALGWNTKLKLSDKWRAIGDVSYSKDTRNETYAEVYAAPFNSSTQQWAYGSFDWNVPVNGGRQTWSPVQANFLSSPSIVKLGDQQAFDFVGDQDAYTGAIRTPAIRDEIKTARFSLQREMDGVFSLLTVGVNYTQRDKNVEKNENRLLMKKDANGNYIRDVPAGALGTPFDMAWAGIPSLIRINVPALVSSGTVTQQTLFAQRVDNNSNVHEKVSTGFAKLDIDTEVLGLTLRGNMGVQAVHTKQSAEGWEYRGNDANPDPALLFPRSGGTSYTDVLPSINLVTELPSNWVVRLGLAKTLARPNITDMRAGTSTPRVVGDQAGPRVGEWTTAYSGNPELKPWKANSMDLSLEKYFGKRSYVSLAAFRKNLLTYIYNQQEAQSTAGFPVVLPPGVRPDQVKPIGPVIRPSNGRGGKVEGIELSFAVEGSMLTSMLDGFGLVYSGSKLSSSIREKDNGDVPLNGLSGRSNSFTLYYEAHGFQARFSQRYRSAFTATTRDIFLIATTRQQAADKVADVQLGYGWEEGALKGLSVLFQVNNLFDKDTYNLKSVGPNAPDASALYANYNYSFGRQSLLGLNYRF
jgi:iron complex outermembrane recepter protein